MPFTPDALYNGESSPLQDMSGGSWMPMYSHECSFPPDIFIHHMGVFVENPNLNSNWLFRADILHDQKLPFQDQESADNDTWSHVVDFDNLAIQRRLVRTLVPRNTKRDAPLDQTCIFYQSQARESDDPINTLVIYVPHIQAIEETPFYHPKVQGIAHLHEWDPATSTGKLYVYFLPFPGYSHLENKLQRIAYHLLELLHKHGQGTMTGYVKRVHHDLVVSRPRFQDRYAEFKIKYAKRLIDTWSEQTDPTKHVFEDLGIAAFLIELWSDMYKAKNEPFPGFVDIGCGNGLLVHILNLEGYAGWGFDARSRKSWDQYKLPNNSTQSGSSLEQRLLLPHLIADATEDISSDVLAATDVHDGKFPQGTFIISNHADELTPWTPLLAAASSCPFISIPCCSHDLGGDKFRAHPPRDKSKGNSTYASLVDWVARIAEDSAWTTETEMLRIPSSRNAALIGRIRTSQAEAIDLQAILAKHGGASKYLENFMQLLKSNPRGH